MTVKVSSSPNLQLILLEHGIAIDKRPDNLEAYDYYLRGDAYCLSNPTKEADEKARQMFHKSIELDPKYANAYVGMAHTYVIDVLNGWTQAPHALDWAFQLEQHALALDPSNAGAYGGMSEIYLFERQYDQSIAAAERAVAIEPNSVIFYAQLASALSFSKPAEAITAAERARRRDPRMQANYLLIEGPPYMIMGRYEETVSALKGYLAGRSSGEYDLIAHLALATSYIELGREAEARAEAAEVLRINPGYTLTDPQKGVIEDVALAERWNDDLRKAGLK